MFYLKVAMKVEIFYKSGMKQEDLRYYLTLVTKMSDYVE